MAGNDQSGNAPFRLQPGVGCPAPKIRLDDILRRGRHGHPVRRALSVKDHSLPGGQPVELQMMGAHQSALLGPGKDHFHRAVRRPGIPYRRQGFQRNGQAGFAVAAQDGAAVGAQRIAVQLGADAPARLHRIQMGRQKHRLPDAVPLGDDVAKGVMLDPAAQIPEPRRHRPVNFILIPGRAVNPYQLHQCLDQSFPVSHPCPSCLTALAPAVLCQLPAIIQQSARQQLKKSPR